MLKQKIRCPGAAQMDKNIHQTKGCRLQAKYLMDYKEYKRMEGKTGRLPEVIYIVDIFGVSNPIGIIRDKIIVY